MSRSNNHTQLRNPRWGGGAPPHLVLRNCVWLWLVHRTDTLHHTLISRYLSVFQFYNPAWPIASDKFIKVELLA